MSLEDTNNNPNIDSSVFVKVTTGQVIECHPEFISFSCHTEPVYPELDEGKCGGILRKLAYRCFLSFDRLRMTQALVWHAERQR